MRFCLDPLGKIAIGNSYFDYSSMVGLMMEFWCPKAENSDRARETAHPGTRPGTVQQLSAIMMLVCLVGKSSTYTRPNTVLIITLGALIIFEVT